jgi:hypothetical protein
MFLESRCPRCGWRRAEEDFIPACENCSYWRTFAVHRGEVDCSTLTALAALCRPFWRRPLRGPLGTMALRALIITELDIELICGTPGYFRPELPRLLALQAAAAAVVPLVRARNRPLPREPARAAATVLQYAADIGAISRMRAARLAEAPVGLATVADEIDGPGLELHAYAGALRRRVRAMSGSLRGSAPDGPRKAV